MVDIQKGITSAKDWVKESEDYTKTLGTDLEQKKSDKSFLNTALEKINSLTKSGEQHSKTLDGFSKAAQLAKTGAQLAGGQGSDTAKQITDVANVVEKVQIALKTLKELKEKITGFSGDEVRRR